MNQENEKKLLEKEIESLNEQINNLAHTLSGLLNVDCTMGLCMFDPEIDSVQKKMEEVQAKKALLERLKKKIDSCLS